MLFLLAACGQTGRRPAGRPNVVLVTLDTTRADHLSVYGYTRPTSPHLARLAREAVVYENAYATSSWTLPSHASLFTGKFPSTHGAQYDPNGPLVLARAILAPAAVRARGLAPDEPTLARRLAEAGYETGAVVGGPWLKAVFGLGSGFASYDDADITTRAGRRAAEVTEAALAWLDRQAGTPARPFFLFLNYFDPHAPYDPPAPWAQRFLPTSVVPDAHPRAHAPFLYDAEILYMDAQLGRVCSWLRERGWWERTLVVVTGDHGELLGEKGAWGHDRFLWEELVRVPLIVKRPGGQDGGKRERARVSLVDVLPMVLDEVGLPPPAGVQGGIPRQASRPVLAEVNPNATGRPTGRWRAHWEGTHKFLWSDLGARHLFDLSIDPHEEHDLAGQRPELARRAEAALLQAFDALPPQATQPSASPSVEVDAETVEALRGLGYLE